MPQDILQSALSERLVLTLRAAVAAFPGCDNLCQLSNSNIQFSFLIRQTYSVNYQSKTFNWLPTPMYQVIEFYKQNLQLARESGQRREEMSALASLARAFDALQERDKAVEFYELALTIARELGDGRAERDTLKHLNATPNPPIPKEIKAKAKSKAVRSRKASAKTSSRKKSTAKAEKKATRKGKPRKFKPVLGQQDSGGTKLDE